MSAFTIGKIAKACGISVETIRFYEREGLLAEPARTASGYRIYPERTVKRLRFITRSKALGFTLAEIRNLLDLSDKKDTDKSAVKALAEKKLALVTQRIADLKRIRTALSELSESCPGEGCLDDCPIINALNADELESPEFANE